MKKVSWLVIASLCFLPALAWSADKEESTVKLESFQEKLGYSMGLDVGSYFRKIGDEISFEALMRGLEDAYNGRQPALSEEEIATVQKAFGEKMQARQQAELTKIMEKNDKLGGEFLAKNAKRKGVTTTESGLQYEVLRKGDGSKPKATDRVKVDYVGTLIDGTEFDSSIKRGQPAVFGVNQVIPGWSEALQLMAVGSKYKLYIPSTLAYGERGAPPVIEPNSVLVFEVDLLGIEE